MINHSLARALGVLALTAACSGEKSPIPDDAEIITTASGLKYSVLQGGGQGASPALEDTVRVHYTGWLTDGTEFDSSRRRGEPSSFGVGQVISGWTEGLQLMRAGERFKFTIPANLAYGSRGRPSIPPDSTLIFDVELVEVVSLPKLPDFFPLDPEKTTRTASGLEYEVIEAGTGASPSATDTVTVHYAGWLTDGTPFDSSFSRGETTSFPLNRVIAGWTEGVQLMKEGAIYKFQIPGSLAYGSRGSPPTIGPNATLIFYIQLVSVD